jgi:hypothetical protein
MEPAAVPRVVRLTVALAALIFFVAHLASLPPALEDIDSINFAMGVRDFDVARHQPHPPGYPVFIALAKITTAAARAVGIDSPEIAGLAFWGAAGGAALLIAIFLFVRALFREDFLALTAMVITAASPLLWFTALRPLSDVAGLGAAGLALAGMAMVAHQAEWDRRRVALLCGSACLAGISIGFRSQMAVLTLSLFGWVLGVSRPRVPLRVAVSALVALAAGGLAWAIPLIVVSGGPDAYLQALGSQAGEDFSGVVMLWTNQTPRVAVFAALNTFMLPWDSPVLAGVLLSLAAAGFCWCVVRWFSRALVLVVVFGPYLVFHLLFQETLTIRYALPLVLPVAILAAVTIAQAGTRVATAATAAIVIAALSFGAPAGAAFSRIESPFTAAMAEMKLLASRGSHPAVGMHRRVWSESRRARPWYGPMPGRALETPRDYEWLELTRAWLGGEEGEIWFLADPRRTDLALIDSEHRRTREYRWPFDSRVYVGGARPDEIDWHIYPPPGWFLERGWALRPEIAGITERDGFGPHRQPSIGWIRRRSNATLMMLGGRHLGGPNDPPVRITTSVDDRQIATFDASPGYFLEFVPVPAGALEGDGRYARLAVRVLSPAGQTGPRLPSGGALPRVGLEQFNLQDPDRVQFGFDDGWLEPEYNPRTARSWRWMSESAALQVHHAGRDVTISLQGESPLRYYDDPPTLRIVAGTITVAELRPDRDFTLEAKLPAALLDQTGGRVVVQSSEFFIPGDRDGSADRRHLALRIYSVTVR